MEDAAGELPVCHEGKDYAFPLKLHPFGYTYRMEVEILETSLFFERDEEGGWRALVEEGTSLPRNITPGLLQAVAQALQELG
jgi:hypothetical protein